MAERDLRAKIRSDKGELVFSLSLSLSAEFRASYSSFYVKNAQGKEEREREKRREDGRIEIFTR